MVEDPDAVHLQHYTLAANPHTHSVGVFRCQVFLAPGNRNGPPADGRVEAANGVG